MINMSQENRIQELLVKLRNETISSSEYKELYDALKEGQQSESLMKDYIHSWDLASKHTGNFNSLTKFSELKRKIEEERDSSERSVLFQTKKTNLTERILQFAAVFILAFVASWFLNNLSKKNITTEQPVLGMHENVVTVKNGSRSKIQLPDGTIVHLNSGSELRYPPLFVDNKREVTLIGEAHFEVEADTSRPFIVKTPEMTLRVTGTVFDVRAYESDDDVQTSLIKGSLDVFTNKRKFETKFNERDKITLKPKEFVRLEKENDASSFLPNKISVKNPEVNKITNTELITAWKDEKLLFDSEPFFELEKRFERWFNVEIEVDNKSFYSRRFTGTFESETVEQVLNAMRLIIPFDYEIDKNIITIK